MGTRHLPANEKGNESDHRLPWLRSTGRENVNPTYISCVALLSLPPHLSAWLGFHCLKNAPNSQNRLFQKRPLIRDEYTTSQRCRSTACPKKGAFWHREILPSRRRYHEPSAPARVSGRLHQVRPGRRPRPAVRIDSQRVCHHSTCLLNVSP